MAGLFRLLGLLLLLRLRLLLPRLLLLLWRSVLMALAAFAAAAASVATAIAAALVVLRRPLVLLRTAPLVALRLRRARLLVQRVARLEARHHAHFHFAGHKALDGDHQRPVIEADQRHRLA